MNPTPKPTPTPWHILTSKQSNTDRPVIGWKTESTEVTFPIAVIVTEKTLLIDDKAQANAAHIVKAVNLHDELCHRVAMLQAILNDSLLPDDCRKYLASDYNYINEKTQDLLKRAKGGE